MSKKSLNKLFELKLLKLVKYENIEKTLSIIKTHNLEFLNNFKKDKHIHHRKYKCTKCNMSLFIEISHNYCLFERDKTIMSYEEFIMMQALE